MYKIDRISMEENRNRGARFAKTAIIGTFIFSFLTFVCLLFMIVYLVPKIETAESGLAHIALEARPYLKLLPRIRQIPEVDWAFFTNKDEQEKFIEFIKFIINHVPIPD